MRWWVPLFLSIILGWSGQGSIRLQFFFKGLSDDSKWVYTHLWGTE